MHLVPRLYSSTAERKVKIESFPNIKPRRGAITLSSPETSTTSDHATFATKLQSAHAGTSRLRSRDQIRQAAGRSGGVFEIAVDATTPWELQYAVSGGHQEIDASSSKTFPLESDTVESGKENTVPQIPIPERTKKDRLEKDDYNHGELRFFGAHDCKTVLPTNADTRYRSLAPIECAAKKHLESHHTQEGEYPTNVRAHYASKSPQTINPIKRALQERITRSIPITNHIPLLHADERFDERLICTSYASANDTASEPVKRIIEDYSLNPDAVLWSNLQTGHAGTFSAYVEALGNKSRARHEDLVSRWSDTTISTDNLTPNSKLECYVSIRSIQSAHSTSASRPLLSSLESTQDADYVSFRSQFCHLLKRGHGYTQAYDQLMHELTEKDSQEVHKGKDDQVDEAASLASTERENETKGQDGGLANKSLIIENWEEAYRLLCGTTSKDACNNC